MSSMLRLFLFSLVLATVNVSAQDFVPDELQDWTRWVLKDREYRDCPFYFDRGAARRDDFVCAWPGRVQLQVDADGARFTQTWSVYADEQWLRLPGSVEHWPDRVTANNTAVSVVARNNVPSVRLSPGTYNIAGRFAWDERPGVLRLPPESGLVSLVVDGKRVERPELTRDGVFLGERERDTRAVDSVRTVIHRLIADDVPTRLVTQLRIDVSGSVREELFGPVLPDGFVPLNIQSQLPAKLEADGNLRLQVRPGSWTVYVNARGPEVLNAIERPDAGTNMPETEIWSYQSNDRLRVTAAEGLPPIDPLQAEVPGGWSNFPAFRADEGATLSIDERSRGIVSASNELELDRTIWLDFDGGGFMVQDVVGGEMRTDWRLDMGPPYALLSATEYGENLLITEGEGEGQTGVEVRQTDVDLEALGRSETRGSMPVAGWDARFAEVDAILHLPPGHKLLAAPGVDNAIGSWASQWRLLDFFLVLIITIAVWRLLGRGAGIIALFALVLSFHEAFAPAWLWLNLLIAIALMRVAPEGRLRKIVSGYRTLSAVALVFALVPFLAGQLRIAIYPQLEPQRQVYGMLEQVLPAAAPAEAIPRSGITAEKKADAMRSVAAFEAEDQIVEEVVVTGARKSRDFARYAPNAIVQAGPGIPSWQWNSYSLRWSGPVDPEQEMRLIVMPRWLVSLLRFAEVALLLLFAAALAAEIAGKRWTLPGGLGIGRGQAAGLAAAGLFAITLAASPQVQAEVPSPEILQQLEQRLLEAPDCVPRCAEIVAADVEVNATTINMALTIHAFEEVAIPLPGSVRGWRPDVVALDGGDARVLRTTQGTLWLRVTEGRHNLTLRGAVPSVDSLEVAFLAPPRVIEVESDGWFVNGIKDRRLLSGSLQLTRLQTESDSGETVRWESSRFPPFALIERTVELDLDWRVRTTVTRVAPAQGALTLDVPLVTGEQIVSGDFTVTDGRVLVSMNPQQRSISWTSNLPRTSPLTLSAEQGASWKEVWRFVVGNVWNADFEGVPESDTGDEVSDVRVAEFNPRGGEQVTMIATRPEASEGSTLAFDSVKLTVNHGNRSSDVRLELAYRSTQGAQHVIRLPENAEVTAVMIDGRTQTLRAENGELTVPILPGTHSIQVDWRTAGAMGLRTMTPEIDIGAPAGNIEMSLTRPRDRWLLATSGPELGPAVLYWSELVALVLLAVVLGRIGLSPLKTRHWLLLGLGFSTFSWPVLGIIIAWLLACGARERWQIDVNWWRFNLIQVGLGSLTVIALLAVLAALPEGLLGTPDMHVAGRNSWGNVLGWFADRSASVLPQASVITVPLWTYKVLILAWALWLSFALLRWLPWVWQCFSSQGYWRSRKADDLQTDQ